MSRDLVSFTIFWGVWLLVPILIDGLTTVIHIVGGWWANRRWKHSPRAETTFYPLVSILVPLHNNEQTLKVCLNSLRQQTYPHERLEIIIINNGSTDRSFTVFDAIQRQPFGGMMGWASIPERGKARALNAGIHLSHGTLILNVDADAVLHPDAVLHMVRAFEADPNLGCATGTIEILPSTKSTPTLLKMILAECEYLEYLASFKIGRVYQSMNHSLYTLAGAFSAFRRDVLLRTFLYSQRTVTEDTDMTFELHQRIGSDRIGCVPEAIAYVEPVSSLKALYSQRVRWQRGQLEVISRHISIMSRNSLLRLHGLSPQRLLLIDHTLSFPRLAWLFFFPALVFFGYSVSLIVSATLFMYIFYTLTEGLWFCMTFLLSGSDARRRLRQSWWAFAFMPAYRFLVFWFRVAGFLALQADPPAWRVRDPITMTRAGMSEFGQGLQRRFGL